jgi:hypothetical protein
MTRAAQHVLISAGVATFAGDVISAAAYWVPRLIITASPRLTSELHGTVVRRPTMFCT